MGELDREHEVIAHKIGELGTGGALAAPGCHQCAPCVDQSTDGAVRENQVEIPNRGVSKSLTHSALDQGVVLL